MCQVHTENAGLFPELCHASPTKFSTAQTPCLALTSMSCDSLHRGRLESNPPMRVSQRWVSPTNRAAANRPVGARPCLARTPEAHKRWVSPSTHPRGTQKVGVPIQPRAARLHYPALTHIEQIAHANSLKRLTSWIQVRAFRHGYLRAGAINCRHKSNECSRQRQQAR